MKISEFAKLFDKKKSTIRHYTEMYLLFPSLHGTYPDYDEQCVQDMKEILEFIDLGFSLEEIRTITIFRNIHMDLTKDKALPVENLLEEKIQAAIDDIQDLEKRLSRLKDYKNSILSKSKNDQKNGSSIILLDKLLCPKCKNTFSSTNCHIENNEIINGYFICTCGCQYKFVDGIFMGAKKDGKEQTNQYYDTLEEFKDIFTPDVVYTAKKIASLTKPYFINNKDLIILGADIDIIFSGLYKNFTNQKIVCVSPKLSALKELKKQLKLCNSKGQFLFVFSEDELPLVKEFNLLIDYSSSFLEAFLGKKVFSLINCSLKQLSFNEVLSVVMDSNDPINCSEHYQLHIDQILEIHKNYNYSLSHKEIISRFIRPDILAKIAPGDYLEISLLVHKK
jgi:DNA-binding transcriptional MerR regulator